MSAATPSVAQLQRALALAEQIQKLEQELAAIMDGSSAAAPVDRSSGPASKPGRRGGKRVVSEETRAKMVAAAKARYARKDSGAAAGKTAPTPKKKRVLSPEGRARIVAALKARHAAKKQQSGS